MDKNITRTHTNIHSKKIWRVHDVALFLECSKKHIYELARKEEIPSFKKGKFRFFIPEEIEEWVLGGNL